MSNNLDGWLAASDKDVDRHRALNTRAWKYLAKNGDVRNVEAVPWTPSRARTEQEEHFRERRIFVAGFEQALESIALFIEGHAEPSKTKPAQGLRACDVESGRFP